MKNKELLLQQLVKEMELGGFTFSLNIDEGLITIKLIDEESGQFIYLAKAPAKPHTIHKYNPKWNEEFLKWIAKQ